MSNEFELTLKDLYNIIDAAEEIDIPENSKIYLYSEDGEIVTAFDYKVSGKQYKILFKVNEC